MRVGMQIDATNNLRLDPGFELADRRLVERLGLNTIWPQQFRLARARFKAL